jgi:hypothetical protein
VTVVTNNLFLRGQHERKLHDRHLGTFTVKEHMEKRNYKLKLLATVRLHLVFHVNNLRPCSKASLRHVAPLVTTPKGDDD